MAGADDDALSRADATTERYRARSRSVATLTAAAAGALAAALALNPNLVSFPFATRILGLAAVALLVISTAIFVVASMIHARPVTPGDMKSHRSNRLFRAWVLQIESSSNAPTAEEYQKSVRIVQRRILGVIDVGMWVAASAILCLICSLVSMAIINEERAEVLVRTYQGSSLNLLCPELPALFKAKVLKADLSSGGELLSVTLDSAMCGDSFPAGVLIVAVPKADLIVIQ